MSENDKLPADRQRNSIQDQIRRIQFKKSREAIQRNKREADKARAALLAKVESPKDPANPVMDQAFVDGLKTVAKKLREGRAKPVRPDIDQAIAAARLKGHLPSPTPIKVGYVPTPEEILGDAALPKSTAPPPPKVPEQNCPTPEAVLSSGYAEGPLSPLELAEIDALNRPKRNVVARPADPMYSTNSKNRHNRR